MHASRRGSKRTVRREVPARRAAGNELGELVTGLDVYGLLINVSSPK